MLKESEVSNRQQKGCLASLFTLKHSSLKYFTALYRSLNLVTGALHANESVPKR